MRPAYPRAEAERRVLERIEAGWTLAQLEGEPGFPARQTVHRWATEDARFAQRLKDARAWRRGLRVQARSAASFNEAVAEEMLLRVRRGEAVRDLMREPGMPGRDELNRWKRARPDFAARLEAAWRFSASLGEKNRQRPFDEAVADRIIARVTAGEPVPNVLAQDGLPGSVTVRKWRAARPEFDAALRAASLAGHRARMRARRRQTPELEAEIIERIVRGASVHSLSGRHGLPHHVTIYGWMRRDPGFADMVRWAGEDRDIEMAHQAWALFERLTPGTLDDANRAWGEVRKQLGRMAPKRRGEA